MISHTLVSRMLLPIAATVRSRTVRFAREPGCLCSRHRGRLPRR